MYESTKFTSRNCTCMICGCIEKPLYGFPTDPELKLKWCQAAKITPKDLTSKSKICRKHFMNSQVVNIRIKPNAVPCVDLPTHQSVSAYEETRKRRVNVTQDLQTFLKSENFPKKGRFVLVEASFYQDLKNECEELKRKCQELSSSTNSLIAENEKHKEKIKKYESPGILNYVIDKTEASEESKSFSKMLLNPKRSYNKPQKKLAATLYQQNSSTYTFLRKRLKFNLPCESTASNWIMEESESAEVQNCPLFDDPELAAPSIIFDRIPPLEEDPSSILSFSIKEEIEEPISIREEIEDFQTSSPSSPTQHPAIKEEIEIFDQIQIKEEIIE